MEAFIVLHKPCMVIDATHPFATIVTATIKKACAATGVKYFRLLRSAGDTSGCIEVNDYEEAAEFLSHGFYDRVQKRKIFIYRSLCCQT